MAFMREKDIYGGKCKCLKGLLWSKIWYPTIIME